MLDRAKANTLAMVCSVACLVLFLVSIAAAILYFPLLHSVTIKTFTYEQRLHSDRELHAKSSLL